MTITASERSLAATLDPVTHASHRRTASSCCSAIYLIVRGFRPEARVLA